MADQQAPTERTPMTSAQVYAALRLAWIALLGTTPGRPQLLTLLAQWAVETGGGGASNNWNLGGIKYTPGCGSDFAVYHTHEILNGRDVVIDQRFRAYASLEDAAADYLRVLRHDFGYAWPAVEAGDVADFAHKLKARGYYTATEESYAAGLAARYAHLEQTIPYYDDTPTMPDSPTALADGRPAYVVEPPDRDPPPEVG